MTSDMWPYSLDLRGFPIVTGFLRAESGEEILVWQSYVVLPQMRFGFNYEQAAFDAGWRRLTHTIDRWAQAGNPTNFAGDARGLCFYIGVGPEWEARTEKKYRANKP